MVTKSQIKLVRSLQQKKYRDELGLFVAEGKKLVEELSKVFVSELIVTPQDATQTQIEQMTALRSPQGYIGVFRKKERSLSELSELDKDSLILVLDGVQDPGNLGTIIRTADWFGIKQIVCSCDTADCYNPKVVQATMGAISRVSVDYTDLLTFLKPYIQKIPIYGTLLEGENIYKQPLSANGIIIMGNEGNGITEPLRKLIDKPLLIPSYAHGETSESLNVAVATAITLAEFRRRTVG